MPAALTRLEIASGTITGSPAAALRSSGRTDLQPVAALEVPILAALLRPPCLLSFSGGKDSSLLLALAMHVARREGLALPVPVSWRFRDSPRAGESEWQEKVIRALDVGDWQILTADDDLDLLGPVARPLLVAHGVRYPGNLHLHLPIIAAAAGGSVLTGLGGDQILTCWHHSGPEGRQRLRRLVPPPVRAARRPRQARAQRPWLRGSAARLVHRRERMDSISAPRSPTARLAWRLGRRQLSLTRDSCAQLGSDHDVEIHHPLLDPMFHRALAAAIPPESNLTRSQLIDRITDERVPAVAYERTTKAWFGEVFARDATRRFVSSWDGRGADADLVDSATLRELWSRWPIPADTHLLVQQLWLRSQQAGSATG